MRDFDVGQSVSRRRYTRLLSEVADRIRGAGSGLRKYIKSSLLEPDYRVVDLAEGNPRWVTSETSSGVVRRDDRYVAVFCGNDTTEELSLAPSFSFDVVEFSVVDVTNADELTVSGEFETVAGEAISKSVTYTNRSTDTVRNGTSSFLQDAVTEFPVTFTFDAPVTGGTVHISAAGTETEKSILDTWSRGYDDFGYKYDREPWVSVPSLRSSDGEHPPIFLISVDALRHDATTDLDAFLDALGDDAVIPSEPRTQGINTPPSHGSLFTGTHPGRHKYLGGLWNENGAKHPLHTELDTIGEVLTECGYKCSGLVSHTRILPELGFGRGFDRYELDPMTSVNKFESGNDIRRRVDTLLRWLEEDTRHSTSGVFYFLHTFDCHFPYLPTRPLMDEDSFDVSLLRRFFDEALEPVADGDENTADQPLTDEEIEEIRSYYRSSVDRTGEQLARFVEQLRTLEMFDESLIILVGDHGEEFFERGRHALHDSLNDRNIRPGMIVKPPASADWSVPDEADMIDVLPTIATAVGEDLPAACQGTPWQSIETTESRPRITEHIASDNYQVSVEVAGHKGIFTFETNYPDRPTEQQIQNGPVREDLHTLSAAREGTYTFEAGTDRAAELREIAREFALGNSFTRLDTDSTVRPSGQTESQLRELGYL